jgi:hypothetical protein
MRNEIEKEKQIEDDLCEPTEKKARESTNDIFSLPFLLSLLSFIHIHKKLII